MYVEDDDDGDDADHEDAEALLSSVEVLGAQMLSFVRL